MLALFDHLRVAQIRMRHQAWSGQTPALGFGSTDANIPIAMGIPAVTVGRGGDGGGAHSLDEWWLNRDGDIAIRRTLLLGLAGWAR